MSDPHEALTEAWRAAGIAEGDTVLLHSSAKRMLRLVMKAKAGARVPALLSILTSLSQALGKGGVAILPTFNFGFAKGQPFDIRTTPSEMGILTEFAREFALLHFKVPARSAHPIYSFVAMGAKRGEEINAACNFSGYGGDSPFSLLHRWRGKVAVLDLPDQDAMTFYHYVEECQQVPWRYHKRFTGPYTGWDGSTSERTFGLFVRDTDAGVVTDVSGMEAHLWERGLYRGERQGQGWGIRTIEATTLFDATAAVIKAGRAEGMLYRREVEHS